MAQCEVTKADGTPCGCPALRGATRCLVHSDPKRARAASARGGQRSRKRRPDPTSNPRTLPPGELLRWLRQELVVLWLGLKSGEVTGSEVYPYAQLAGVLRAACQAELEARELEELREAVTELQATRSAGVRVA